jgi:hypothetical protein
MNCSCLKFQTRSDKISGRAIVTQVKEKTKHKAEKQQRHNLGLSQMHNIRSSELRKQIAAVPLASLINLQEI